MDAALDDLAGVGRTANGGERPAKRSIPDYLPAPAVSLWADGARRTPIPFDLAPRGTNFPLVAENLTDEATVPLFDFARNSGEFTARLAVILLAAGSCGHGASRRASRNRRFTGLQYR
jgi:hypothetical protein